MATQLPRPIYGSDLAVWMMRQLEVPYIALNTGSSFRGLQDSVVNYANNVGPEIIQCTHEEISVAIAHAYAKAACKPMVAAAHNVVGLQHASMAIYNAYTDRAPVIVVGGTGPMDATTRRPGIDWLHTALVQGELVRNYVKWDDQPSTIGSIPDSLLRGYQTATMHPQGPVYICYDSTIQEGMVSEDLVLPVVGNYPPPSPMGPDPDALRILAGWLVEAQAPLVVADHVGKDPQAVEALIELAELLALPVADRGGRFNFPSNHPLDVTGTELDLFKDRDLVLVLESRDPYGLFHVRDLHHWDTEPFIPPSCKVASISLWDLRGGGWAQDYQRIAPLDLNILADTSVALPMLVDECRKLLGSGSRDKYDKRYEAIRTSHDETRARWQQRAQENRGVSPVSTGRLASEVWQQIQGEDWVLGNGNAAGWARRLWDFDRHYRHIGASGGGGLGYGYGAAIGAALAHRDTDRLIVNIQSDGDLMYTPGALWTASHHRLPILTVMFNNRDLYNSDEHAYNVASMRDRRVDSRGIGVYMDDPPVDFAKLAEAQGVFAIGPIDDPEKLAPALQEAMRMVKEEKLPALVDVVCQLR